MDWMKLKSGSDVRGVAMGENRVLTEEVARALGMAFAHMVAERGGKSVNEVSIAIGRDDEFRHVYHAGHVYGDYHASV